MLDRSLSVGKDAQPGLLREPGSPSGALALADSAGLFFAIAAQLGAVSQRVDRSVTGTFSLRGLIGLVVSRRLHQRTQRPVF